MAFEMQLGAAGIAHCLVQNVANESNLIKRVASFYK